MKNRLETQAKPAYFHWIFAFHTVAQHPYASPVVCSKLSVIVCIKSWPLLKNKRQLQLFFIIKFMNKNGVHIKAMDCCCVRIVVILYKVMATVDSCYVKERFLKLRNHYEKAWILRPDINQRNCFIQNSQHQESLMKSTFPSCIIYSLFSNEDLWIITFTQCGLKLKDTT